MALPPPPPIPTTLILALLELLPDERAFFTAVFEVFFLVGLFTAIEH